VFAFLKGRQNRKLSMCRRIAVVLLSIGATTAAGSLTGCCYTGPTDLAKGEFMSGKTIEQVQEEHTDDWMVIPGVEGTAIGLFEGKACIKIFSSMQIEELRAQIPSVVDGYPVIIEEAGTFRALDEQ